MEKLFLVDRYGFASNIMEMKNKNEPIPVRVDFVMLDQVLDETTRTVRGRMVPDPRRYESITRGGETWYRDRYLNLEFGPEVLRTFAEQSLGLPVGYNPPNIASATEYAASRGEAVAQEITTGAYVVPLVAPDPHRPFLIEEKSRPITFLSVDICNSTSSRAKNPVAFDQSYRLFKQEMGAAVGQFHGSILKLTGDGFIAYLDDPIINTQADNAVDLSLSLIELLAGGLNPALKSANLPDLQVRVGADIGVAKVVTTTIVATGYSESEVASDALNLAVKIGEAASPGEVWIGRHLYTRLHLKWLERAENRPDLELPNVPGYPVYRLR